MYVTGLFVAVNTIFESHVVVPLIQRYIVSLPPGVAVVALVLMGKLFGFFGVLLAIPLAASLIVLVRLIYVEGVLGDRGEEASECAPKTTGRVSGL